MTRTTTTDDLASRIEANLTIADARGKQKATERTLQRATSTRSATRKQKPIEGENASEVAGLATELASGLGLGGRSPEKTREERCMDAMREVNLSSRALSAIVETGWKSSQAVAASAQRSSSSRSRDQDLTAKRHATAARDALKVLRDLKPGDVDIERAASSLVGKLISLELVRAHLPLFR